MKGGGGRRGVESNGGEKMEDCGVCRRRWIRGTRGVCQGQAMLPLLKGRGCLLLARQVCFSSFVFNLVNTCYRSSSTKAQSCYRCKGLKKPCGMEVPKKKAKKTKMEASGVMEKSGAAKTSGATGGTAERSRSAVTDGMAELTRAVWAIARALGGIWRELKEVKELLGVMAYKEEDDDEDASESTEESEEGEDGEEGMEVDGE